MLLWEELMDLKVGELCVLMNDSWNALKLYRVKANQADVIELKTADDYSEKGPFRIVIKTEAEQIFVSPCSMDFFEAHPEIHRCVALIDDLTGALLGVKKRISITDLINELKEDSRLGTVSDNFIEGCLRIFVANGEFIACSDGRRGVPCYKLELSGYRKQRERNRVFAGSFADELQLLSKQIGNLISHSGTVGTYRENLLQTLLQKHLPERYHVATGFIHGCHRQLDVLIYDRIDYAPLFREGDLVVVPSESVRAVIEVKTNLTKDKLRNSLNLLTEVACADDLRPPFFRGIFGFESSTSADEIFDCITDFYVENSVEMFEDAGELSGLIFEPFRHISSVCVLGHAYAEVNYVLDGDKKYHPALMKASSKIGLNTQAAHFLQHLLAYLRFGGLKSAETPYIKFFLGADSLWVKHSQLVRMGMEWGAYFDRDAFDYGDEVVEEMEQHIENVQCWLNGEPWSPSQMG
ncbi:hypothetical protein GCM10027202_15590 [Microvirgula curvata]